MGTLISKMRRALDPRASPGDGRSRTERPASRCADHWGCTAGGCRAEWPGRMRSLRPQSGGSSGATARAIVIRAPGGVVYPVLWHCNFDRVDASTTASGAAPDGPDRSSALLQYQAAAGRRSCGRKHPWTWGVRCPNWMCRPLPTEPVVQLHGVGRRTAGRGGRRVLVDLISPRTQANSWWLPVRRGRQTDLAACRPGDWTPPDRGSVIVGGRDLWTMKSGARAHSGAGTSGSSSSFFNLVPMLSAVENVSFRWWSTGCRPDAADARAAELLERGRLRRPGRASAGGAVGRQMQRVAVARALVARPAVVLAGTSRRESRQPLVGRGPRTAQVPGRRTDRGGDDDPRSGPVRVGPGTGIWSTDAPGLKPRRTGHADASAGCRWSTFRRIHLSALIGDRRRTLLSIIGVAVGVSVVRHPGPEGRTHPAVRRLRAGADPRRRQRASWRSRRMSTAGCRSISSSGYARCRVPRRSSRSLRD